MVSLIHFYFLEFIFFHSLLHKVFVTWANQCFLHFFWNSNRLSTILISFSFYSFFFVSVVLWQNQVWGLFSPNKLNTTHCISYYTKQYFSRVKKKKENFPNTQSTISVALHMLKSIHMRSSFNIQQQQQHQLTDWFLVL